MTTFTPADYKEYWEQAISYSRYLGNIEREAACDTLTGNNKYIPLNLQRMHRIDKITHLSEEAVALLGTLKENIYWLVITENWCGDAAQSTPVMHRLAAASGGKIALRFIYRDQHLALMNAHLTGTSQSIPKIIQLNHHFDITGTWGPRPAKAHQMVLRLKSNPETAGMYAEQLHKWYAQDKQAGIELELLALVKEAVAKQAENAVE